MAKIFISFVHDDRPVAEALKALIEHELNLRGKVFMVTDPSQLRPGDDWLKTIREALESADIVLLMMSKRSVGTPWVNFEAGGMDKRETSYPCLYRKSEERESARAVFTLASR